MTRIVAAVCALVALFDAPADEAVGGGLVVALRGGRSVELSRRRSDRLREILSL